MDRLKTLCNLIVHPWEVTQRVSQSGGPLLTVGPLPLSWPLLMVGLRGVMKRPRIMHSYSIAYRSCTTSIIVLVWPLPMVGLRGVMKRPRIMHSYSIAYGSCKTSIIVQVYPFTHTPAQSVTVNTLQMLS